MKPCSHPGQSLDQQTLYALDRYSFSDGAARHIASHRHDLRVANVGSIEQVFDAMNKNDSYGLIPIENASGGLVVPHLDMIAEKNIRIVGDIRYKVRMCMGGKAGGTHDSITSFHSHGKGLDQCTKLTGLYPGAKKRAHNTTVDAVRYVRSIREYGHVALASREAIEAQEGNEVPLEVYAADVANHPGDRNRTKFYIGEINGDHDEPDPEALNHAMLITPENSRGILQRLLGMIANARVNLTSLHSRNIDLDEYMFFIEMRREGLPEQFELLSRQLAIDQDVKNVQWLGSWDESHDG